MKRIILHAGLPKTGSTAIQRFLSERREALLRLGILFPEAGATNGGNHKPLVAGMLGRPLPKRYRDAPDAFLEECARHPGRTVLVSAEFLGNYFGGEGKRTAVLDFLAAAGFRTTILVYVRPDAEQINSSYVQQVKTFEIDAPFRDYALERADKARSRYAQFRKLARPPEVETMFRPYDGALRASGVVRDLLAAIDLSASERDALGAESRLNEAPVGPVAIAAARATLARLRAGGRELTDRQKTAMQRELLGLVERDEPEPPFRGVDAGLARAIDERLAEERNRFSLAAWGRNWDEVFPPTEAGELRANLFDPAGAEPSAATRYERLLDRLGSAAEAVLADETLARAQRWGRGGRRTREEKLAARAGKAGRKRGGRSG